MNNSVLLICLGLWLTACNKESIDDLSVLMTVDVHDQVISQASPDEIGRDMVLPVMVDSARNPFVWEDSWWQEQAAFRKKEPLEMFALDNLKLVGSLLDRRQAWALIKTAEKNIVHIQSGQHIGLHAGVVQKISLNSLEISEPTDKPLSESISTVMTLVR